MLGETDSDTELREGSGLWLREELGTSREEAEKDSDGVGCPRSSI